MNEIPVYCTYAALVEMSTIKPNPCNPNKHPPSQIALLAKNIQNLGWRHPIIISKRSGLIVVGHARWQAARQLQVAVVPVDYQDFASAAEEHAYLIADNRIAELAEMDTVMLTDLLKELNDGSFDMDLTGFNDAALERLFVSLPDENMDIDEDELEETENVCPRCGFKW